jgi:hypothetical protein
MDEVTRRHQEHLAKCQAQIEKSREMIEISQRWLVAYQASYQERRDSGGADNRAPLIVAGKAATARPPVRSRNGY